MGWQQEDAINEKHERSVLTSFVIIEKKLGKYNLRYETPTFDLNGNKIVWSSWSSFSIDSLIPTIFLPFGRTIGVVLLQGFCQI